MKETSAILDQIVQSCCEDLFPWSSYTDAQGDLQSDEKVTAVIGFAGDNFKGALGLTASTETITATLPSDLSSSLLSDDERDSQPYDWLAELANQLLGRIKGNLLPYGLEAWLSEPVVLRGLHVRLSPRPEEGIHNYSFSGKLGSLWVWLDLRGSPDFELQRLPEQSKEACNPGDFMLL